MSFFDEVEEPRPSPRSAPARRRTSGGRRRPPGEEQAIRRRQIVAILVIVVAIVLIAVGINSCQASQRSSALKDYNANVAAVAGQSVQTARQFFAVLTSGNAARSVYTSLNQARNTADGQLRQARGFSTPDGLQEAQQYLVLALRLRRDAIGGVAQNIEQALGGQTSRDAVNAIAAQMARLYASDVVYKGYTLPLIVGALKHDGIAVGGLNGQPINSDQALPDVRWLTPTFIASQLHIRGAAAPAPPFVPGNHGHGLNSVSVGATTLTPGATNTLPASPTFTLNFTNLGAFTEVNVVCKVTLAPATGAASISATTTVPQTTAGQTATCTVPLKRAPSPGAYTLTATIEPVRGENDLNNNTMTFPVSIG